jgi:FkbM family methyltransferase
MKLIERAYYQNKTLRSLYQSTGWIRRPFGSKKIEHQEKIINNLIALMIEDPILNVEEFKGEFCFDVRSHLFKRLVVDSYYEPELAKLCSAYVNPQKDVIDIGANIGLFTVMLAKEINESRKVLAIEPTKNASFRLLQNIERNEVKDKVEVFKGVASNTSGSIEIKTIAGKEEYSSIGNIAHPIVDAEQYVIEKVDGKTVDDLVSVYSIDPGFIKIDVEGCEHLVLGGAQSTLINKRPIIISELSDFLLSQNGSSSEEVIQLIKKNDYDIFDPLDPSSKPGSKEFGDIICFPKEMNISIDKLISTSRKTN